MKRFLVLVIVIVGCSASHRIGSFIQPCHEKDNACLKSSAEKALPVIVAGVPSMGISNMDPMHMGRIKTTQAGLEMDFRNTTVTGLKNCRVLSLKRHGHRTYLDLKCSVTMVGDYTLGGKLLIMPINGNGRYKIRIRDIVVKIVFQVGERMMRGDQYWHVNNFKHTSEVLGNVQFHFNNLFNGNKQFAETVIRFANENWREIFQEVSPPILKAIVTQIVSEISKLFDKVPIKDLVLN